MGISRWVKLGVAAVIAVVIAKTLIAGSYIIPSSGMENSLYEGEGVLVGKWSYGLRTPLPSLFGYHRLGAKQVKKGDIVVFNNPAQAEKGVEFRDVFISRCAATAGDTILLNSELTETGAKMLSPDSKTLYAYPPRQEELVEELMKALGIKGNTLVSYTSDGDYVRSFSHYEFYLMKQKSDGLVSLTPVSEIIDEAKPFVVPKKGMAVEVQPWNAILLCNTIKLHEHKKAKVKGDSLFVGGKAVAEYRFSKDYYWMTANDPVNLCDSRLFGFVPEDHIVGKAWRIWLPKKIRRLFQKVK